MKNIMKIIPLLLLLTVVVGCGKIEEIETVELSKLLNSSVAFSEHLTHINAQYSEKRYSLNPKDYSEISAYVGTAAVCDEFVIVKTETTEAMKEKLEKYIGQKRKIYEKYRPGEVSKLDSAIIETYNNAVVMIITADTENALDVYREYLKK